MNELTLAILCGSAGMLGWGLSDFFAKKIISQIGSLKTAIALQIFGGIALIAIFLARGAQVPELDTADLIKLSGLTAMNAAGYLLLYRAFEKGTLSIISPIAASSCGVSVLISYFFFEEPMGAQKSAGLLLIFIGILLASVDFREIKSQWSAGILGKGVMEGLGVMVVMGLWFPLWSEFMRGRELVFWSTSLKVGMGVLMLTAFFASGASGGLFSSYRLAGPPVVLIALIDVAAYLAVSYGFYATSGMTSLITVLAHAYSIPTLILAYVLLRERISFPQRWGIALILAGIFFTSRA